MAVQPKTNRIEFRIADEAKRILEEAASIKAQTLSNYIINVALKQAQMDVAENESIRLSSSDRRKVISLLEEGLEPNAALVNLFK